MSPTRRSLLRAIAAAGAASALGGAHHPSAAAAPSALPTMRIRATMQGLYFAGDTIEERWSWLELRIAPDTVSAHARIEGTPALDVHASTDPVVVEFMRGVAALFDRHAVRCDVCQDRGSYRLAFSGEVRTCPVCGPLPS